MGPGVNTATNETNLFVSDDELTILFAGDLGGHLLWMATRPALDAPFANRRPLELPYEPRKGTEGRTVFDNGRVLVFTSNFTGSKSWDLWWSQRVPR